MLFYNKVYYCYYYYYYYYYYQKIIYYYFVSVKCSTTATELNVTWKNMIKGTLKNDTRGYQVEVRRNKERVEVKNLNSSSHHYFLNRLGNYVNRYFPYFIRSLWKVYIIGVKIYWIIVWQRNGKIAETFLLLLTSPGSIPWPVLERSLWFVFLFFFFLHSAPAISQERDRSIYFG